MVNFFFLQKRFQKHKREDILQIFLVVMCKIYTRFYTLYNCL